MDVDSHRRTDDLSTPLPLDVKLDVLDSEVEDLSEGEEEEEEEDDEDWLRTTEEEQLAAQEALQMVRSTFKDDVDMFDTTMVAEYAEEIFGHMEALEETTMPNPRYMDFQTEIEW